MEAFVQEGNIIWIIVIGLLFLGILFWGFAPRFRKNRERPRDHDDVDSL